MRAYEKEALKKMVDNMKANRHFTKGTLEPTNKALTKEVNLYKAPTEEVELYKVLTGEVKLYMALT